MPLIDLDANVGMEDKGEAYVRFDRPTVRKGQAEKPYGEIRPAHGG